MSEFTEHKRHRVEKLTSLFQKIVQETLTAETVAEYQQVIDRTEPADVIAVVDELMKMQIPMPELKKGINKALNLLNKALREFPYGAPSAGSFLDCLIRDNAETDVRLKNIRPLLKMLNQNPEEQLVRKELTEKLTDLQKIDLHYQIKENIFFPVVEKYLSDYRCLQVMWSFHDDIRRNLKQAIQLLGERNTDIQLFNRLMGDIYFNIYAIIFREERILFPVVSTVVQQSELDSLINESAEIGFPFIHPVAGTNPDLNAKFTASGAVDLKTGVLSVDQIQLIFNHLPVDITYVDENNKVKFFSTPEKRIFRRTNSIIGRDVKNCHPHESVHVVEQIVEAFRKGEKSKASFWIQMKGEFVLIQYFAVRDEHSAFRGVIEVTQEIGEIRSLKGEKRLLDWE